MKQEQLLRSWVTITHGMRGYFAIMVGKYTDGYNEYHDVIQTGIGSYPTREGAILEGKEWAEAEGVQFEI